MKNFLQYVIDIITTPKRVWYDIWSTLYDADRTMSQPRFFCFALFSLIIIAWFLEQCLRWPFEHFAELVGAFGIAMGGYVGKKISENKATEKSSKLVDESPQQ